MTALDSAAFSAGAAFIDNRIVPIAEARIPITDLGFLHSDATYDVVHAWQGKWFRLEDHLDRFLRGMQRLRMKVPYDRDRIREILTECVVQSGLRDAYVEMVCTRGQAYPGSRDPRLCSNRFYAFALPFASLRLATPEKEMQGLHLVISQVQRIPGTSVDPTVKNYHWLDLVAGLFEAYERGGETTALSDREHNVVEGPGFNVFVIKGGRAATPESGMLEGITRRTALEICRALDIPVAERKVPAGEVRQADEVFVTSTAAGIVPITRVDGQPVADGKPGPLTLRIRERYWALHDHPDFATPIPY